MSTIPLPEDVMSVVTDASGLGIGGVLQVRRGDTWEAAAFFSRRRGQSNATAQRNWRLWHLWRPFATLGITFTVKHLLCYRSQASVPAPHLEQTEQTSPPAGHETSALAGGDMLPTGVEQRDG